jgi:carboxypeptidase D
MLTFLQNTTFGGIQGFTQKPSTPWYNDNGQFAGIVHQERGWTYVLFDNAGHLVSVDAPVSVWASFRIRECILTCTQAFTFAREFLFGSNSTGQVTLSGAVVGGEDPSLEGDVLPGNSALYLGSGATQSTYVFPSATIAAWDAFIQTAEPQAIGRSGSNVMSSPAAVNNAASRGSWTVSPLLIIICILGWSLA